MNFINNWAGRLTAELPAAGTALPVAEELLARLDLTGGAEYVLTLTDKLDYLGDPTPVYEVVHITAAGLERGQEGTIARDWPADTIVFADVTAGVLAELAQGGGGGGVGAWQPLALIDGQDWQGWAFARLEGDIARVWFSVTALREGGFGVPDSPAFELPPALRPVNNPFGSARFTVVCQGSDGGPRAGVMEIDSSGYPGFYLPEGMPWAAGTRLTADVTFSQTAFPFP